LGLALAILAGVGFIIVEAKTEANRQFRWDYSAISAFSAATIVGFRGELDCLRFDFWPSLSISNMCCFSRQSRQDLAFLPIALTNGLLPISLPPGPIASPFRPAATDYRGTSWWLRLAARFSV